MPRNKWQNVSFFFFLFFSCISLVNGEVIFSVIITQFQAVNCPLIIVCCLQVSSAVLNYWVTGSFASGNGEERNCHFFISRWPTAGIYRDKERYNNNFILFFSFCAHFFILSFIRRIANNYTKFTFSTF